MTDALLMDGRVLGNIANLDKLAQLLPGGKLTNIDLLHDTFDIDPWTLSRGWWRWGRALYPATCHLLRQLYSCVELTDAVLTARSAVDERARLLRRQQAMSVRKSLYFFEVLENSYGGAAAAPELHATTESFQKLAAQLVVNVEDLPDEMPPPPTDAASRPPEATTEIATAPPVTEAEKERTKEGPRKTGIADAFDPVSAIAAAAAVVVAEAIEPVLPLPVPLPAAVAPLPCMPPVDSVAFEAAVAAPAADGLLPAGPASADASLPMATSPSPILEEECDPSGLQQSEMIDTLAQEKSRSTQEEWKRIAMLSSESKARALSNKAALGANSPNRIVNNSGIGAGTGAKNKPIAPPARNRVR